MDLFIKDGNIFDIKFSNALIQVTKNYVYEEDKLLASSNYDDIFDCAKNLTEKYKFVNEITDSHDMVSYLMILMNYNCAKELMIHKTGIFRSTVLKNKINVPNTLPEDVSKFIKIFNSASGQYVDGSNAINISHELLELDAYIHITSPIRRLVDLLNMIKIQSVLGIIQLNEESNAFYEKWLSKMEYINTTMRSIRKLQTDSSMLDLYANLPQILEKEYDGYLFNKKNDNDGLYQYSVYLPELKLSSRIKLREEIDNYSCHKIKMFMFNNEDKFKRKIRLQLK